MERASDRSGSSGSKNQFRFLEYVVAEEDYATGIAQQRNCDPAPSHVLFGKNELGGQQFHAWVDRIIDASDDELPGLFAP